MAAGALHQAAMANLPSTPSTAGRTKKAIWPAQLTQIGPALRLRTESLLKVLHRPRIILTHTQPLHVVAT